MNTLRVRVYNVHFGDAILISVPDRGPNNDIVTRHILIDFGNVLQGKNQAGADDVFAAVIDDVLKVLGGRPLDLYIMTHEHMDHIQGLPYVFKKLKKQLKVEYSWLSASSEATYYDTHPNSRKRKLALEQAYADIEQYFTAVPDPDNAPFSKTTLFGALMFNNNPNDTAACVETLRKLTDDPAKTTYVHCDTDIQGRHPFNEVRFEIWGPEEDTSVYYRRVPRVALGVTPPVTAKDQPSATEITPPAGVDASAFYNLVELRQHSYVDNLLAIDQAANNTSIVFCLEWRGWRLLFPGDAELASWRVMNQKEKLKPVHFLKVGHHGSHNGTPPAELLDKIFPMPHNGRKRSAAISTWLDVYNNVPHGLTTTELKLRCQDVRSTALDLADDAFYLDFEFSGEQL